MLKIINSQAFKVHLLYYYIVLQGLHGIALLWFFLGDNSAALNLLLGVDIPQAAQYLKWNAAFDLLVVIPSAFILFALYKRQKHIHRGIARFTLGLTMLSALFYEIVLITHSVWNFSWLNILIHLLFAPTIFFFLPISLFRNHD